MRILITGCLCWGTALLLLTACASAGEGAADGPTAEASTLAGSPSLPAVPEGERAAAVGEASLPDLGPAPAWQNERWINSERPLLLQELRGKVILLEFWTFG